MPEDPSRNHKLLDASIDKAPGEVSLAVEPCPSIIPALVEPATPAKVDTLPEGESFRTQLLAESVTNMVPEVSRTMPTGALNKALEP